MTQLKIAAFQMDIEFEDPDANCQRLVAASRTAVNHGADVLITPEMFSTGFSMNTELVAAQSESTRLCICDCAKNNNINIIAGYARRLSGNDFANVAMVVDRTGAVIYEYRKTYMFSLMHEDHHFVAGNGMAPFTLEGVRIAIGICYDIRFPELFRPAASNVDAFIIPASWPGSRQAHWDILLRARAVENQAYVVGINRVGTGDGLEFKGGTAIILPSGEVVDSLYHSEGLVSACVSTDEVHQLRTQYPFLRDIR
ncbi:MAG: hypothetical protein JXX14_05090 [Deltaproteobacteria bacterium]|nr:hypothetical protein [Deltaproteobacteria bacterium]